MSRETALLLDYLAADRVSRQLLQALHQPEAEQEQGKSHVKKEHIKQENVEPGQEEEEEEVQMVEKKKVGPRTAVPGRRVLEGGPQPTLIVPCLALIMFQKQTGQYFPTVPIIIFWTETVNKYRKTYMSRLPVDRSQTRCLETPCLTLTNSIMHVFGEVETALNNEEPKEGKHAGAIHRLKGTRGPDYVFPVPEKNILTFAKQAHINFTDPPGGYFAAGDRCPELDARAQEALYRDIIANHCKVEECGGQSNYCRGNKILDAKLLQRYSPDNKYTIESFLRYVQRNTEINWQQAGYSLEEVLQEERQNPDGGQRYTTIFQCIDRIAELADPVTDCLKP